MSCFRAALQLPARVKRSEVTELSVQNWGAKRLSFVPALSEGLAGGEGCLAATGRQRRGERCSNYCSDWCLAGWTMFRQILHEELLSSRNKCSDGSHPGAGHLRELQLSSLRSKNWGSVSLQGHFWLHLHMNLFLLDQTCNCDGRYLWHGSFSLFFSSLLLAKVLNVPITFPVAIVELISCSLEWWNQMLDTFLIK